MIAHETEQARRGQLLEKIRPRLKDVTRAWVQMGGGRDASGSGALIVRHSAFDTVEVVEIESVRDHGDDHMNSVHFPYYRSSGEIDAEDMHLGNPKVLRAVRSLARDVDQAGRGEPLISIFYNGDSHVRASILWEARDGETMGKEHDRAGWSTQVLPVPADMIAWWARAGAGEDFHEEDLAFRDELLARGYAANSYPWDDEVITHYPSTFSARGNHSGPVCGRVGPVSDQTHLVDCDDCLQQLDDE